MMRLEKRPEPSRVWSLATPVLAVIATMIAGGLLFALLGKNPLEAIRTIFWDPLFGEFASYYRPQLLVKGAPLVLIAIGLMPWRQARLISTWSTRAPSGPHRWGAVRARLALGASARRRRGPPKAPYGPLHRLSLQLRLHSSGRRPQRRRRPAMRRDPDRTFDAPKRASLHVHRAGVVRC